MRAKMLAWVATIAFLSVPVVADHPTESSDESLEVAELIVHLARDIAANLDAPVIGADRIVTNAIVSDEGGTRSYYIEGQDVFHGGHVHSTYWLRLIKGNSGLFVQSFGHGPMHGRALSSDTHELIGPLLNSVYDIAKLSLDHRKVSLGHVHKTNDEPLTFELLGLNDVCDHIELNVFKMTVIRRIENNLASYETQLVLPHPLSDDHPSIRP